MEAYVRPQIEGFLRERGLTISEAKTRIVHIDEGFNFLGFHIRKFGRRETLLTVPRKEKVLKHLRGIKTYLKTHRQSPAGLVVKELNPVIRGWTNYYRHVCSKKTFDTIRHRQYWMLWRWATRRHPHKAVKWVLSRYFRYDGYWRFSTPETFDLVQPDRIPITRYTKVTGRHSPYDPILRQYWTDRNVKQVIVETYSKQRLVLHEKQEFKCALCGGRFIPGETIQIDHRISKFRGDQKT